MSSVFANIIALRVRIFFLNAKSSISMGVGIASKSEQKLQLQNSPGNLIDQKTIEVPRKREIVEILVMKQYYV